MAISFLSPQNHAVVSKSLDMSRSGLVGALVVVLAAWTAWQLTSANAPPHSPWYDPASDVPRRTWASLVEESCVPHSADGGVDDESGGTAPCDVSRMLSTAGSPVILTESQAAAWPALEKWRDLSYLAAHVPELGHPDSIPVLTQKREHPVFIYQAANRFLGQYMENTFGTLEHSRSKVPIERFFEAQSDSHMYYSNRLGADEQHGQNELAALDADARPRDMFQVLGETGKPHTVIWIGNNGTTANAHYDAQINVFAQVVGRKRFTLFPPTKWRELRVHPLHHPRNRQSQRYYRELGIGLGGVDEGGLVAGTVAELGPGDVLFLPPYWFHRVESLSSPSISVTSWSPMVNESDILAVTKARAPKSKRWRLGLVPLHA